jgi:hypothetical protein
MDVVGRNRFVLKIIGNTLSFTSLAADESPQPKEAAFWRADPAAA